MDYNNPLDKLIEDINTDMLLEVHIDSIIFRLNALKAGKKLSFKNADGVYQPWVANIYNPDAILEGDENSPSIIRMDIEWIIEG